MGDLRNRKWAAAMWVIGLIVAWGFVGQLFVWVFLGLMLLNAGVFAAVALTSLALGAVSWFSTRFFLNRGAPRLIALSTVIGLLPLAGLMWAMGSPGWGMTEFLQLEFDLGDLLYLARSLVESALVGLMPLLIPLAAALIAGMPRQEQAAES